jgi:hypothetical protein
MVEAMQGSTRYHEGTLVVRGSNEATAGQH